MPPSQRDSYLLFHDLPYDFETDLPLSLGPQIYLDNTPKKILDSVEPSAWADYVLPGYNCIGGLNNCCLYCPASDTRPLGLEPSDLFYLAVPALRLRAPLNIHIAGQFEVGAGSDLIKNPILYQLISPWRPLGHFSYSGQDINAANEIAKRLLQVTQNNYKKFNSAAVLFGQVTCGHSKSFQMAYLALFATLEALFTPGKPYANVLSRRIANFLSRFTFPAGSIEDWLRDEYTRGRSDLAHGVQTVTPWARTRNHRAEALGRLHEIARLSILGFLSLDESKLSSLSNNTGTRLQHELDNLSPASGQFINEQRFWCN